MQLNNATTETIYAEHTNDPSSWVSPRPSFDLATFNARLETHGGTIGSMPRFRARWAPDDERYLLDENAFLVGYTFMENGEERFVSCSDGDFEFPDGAVVSPKYDIQKCFIPRWAIEQWTDGSYETAWYVEEIVQIAERSGHKVLMSHYCEPSEHDLEMAAKTRHLGENLTPQDIAESLAKRNARRVKEYNDAKEEIRQDNHHWANKFASDGVPSPVFSIPKVVVPKNISKEQIAKI